MAFVSKTQSFNVGDVVVTARQVECLAGYFEKGTKVKIVFVDERGYSLQDEYGNTIRECGFDAVKRAE